ncbi:unnamed protein product [Allacma fusca]|uniref:Uncharacterized protein n=1 Tax=Allacma fusca TaxID=39272 RepID=A0A8J2KIF3_9HEXA|nr:unnamed protein product [Allacma fusca]
MDKPLKKEPLEGNFKAKKSGILIEIERLSTEYQSFWKSLAEQFQICSTLILKQAFLSGRFSEFYVLWQEKVDENLDVALDRAEALEAVNEKVLQINNILFAHEKKAQDTHSKLKELTEKFQKELSDLQQAESDCTDATTLDQLRFKAYDFTDCKAACPDVKQLCNEWDQLGLHAELDRCFERLRRI